MAFKKKKKKKPAGEGDDPNKDPFGLKKKEIEIPKASDVLDKLSTTIDEVKQEQEWEQAQEDDWDDCTC
ncbi:MAG: hypothetical protein GTN93_33975 [Anaerolineae bacterium]|nr:hypothetical protein [Anaerolineae bacterium]